ncbi:MAG: chemotaxis protein CheB, partial [Acidobacteria bacterium]
VILTGTNNDGARGLAKIKARGGLTVVEDPYEAAFPEMPRAAIESSEVDWIVTLDELAPLLNRLATSTVRQYAN